MARVLFSPLPTLPFCGIIGMQVILTSAASWKARAVTASQAALAHYSRGGRWGDSEGLV